ncbi:carboxypeptidase-like regulatory domain-containing protein [Algibacter sp. AS12]|uniref:TonB-dependent receptor n=1 Tax=Algibacter sp. AS12 TaxID=3135773 RepID=UPI00398A5A21
MKRTTRFLMFTVAMLFSVVVMAQSTISGVITEVGSNMPLPGANVIEKGTTNGVVTDFDGNFTINTKSSTGDLVISYVGYNSKTIAFTASASLGKIALESSQVGLDEVQIIASVAVDRKTPVAVSTIKADEISLKLSTQEFPEILKSTPGIYATKQGGGYGDARVNIRGFSSENVAVMINGIPVNDMENGAVYWSNWAGLGDVTSTMQVQRGLGASKVAVPSIGGTINIITKTTDVEEGGNFFTGIGNNGYLKYGMTYSTGLSEKGFAATVSASKIEGDGYVDGTEFSGYNYFINLSQQINEAHRISFSAFGAQQEHGQRFNRSTIAELRQTEQGPLKANKDWGYKNGEVYHQSYNFYHKPQMSINHLWDINDKSVLSTAVYASFGKGGGRRDEGDKIGSDDYRIGGVDQPIDFDTIVEENIANGVAGSSDIIASTINGHKWYGILSTYKNDITDKLVLSGGFDGRYYVGSHYYIVEDLLGGQFYLDNETDTKAFGQALQVGDRYNKDYDGYNIRTGFFGQAEYQVNDEVNVFMAADVSNTTYFKKEFMSSEIPDGDRKSDKVTFVGFGVKGGGNYNLDANNNVFVNVGYFEKAPFLVNVFPQEDELIYNQDAVNEKVFSAEVGYGFRSEKLSANVNLYHTRWSDKAESRQLPETGSGDILYANILGIDALHQGLEIDFKYKPTSQLTITGMASLGDWQWKSNVDADIFTQDGDLFQSVKVFADGIKVGNSAQTTFALGTSYDFTFNTKLYVDYNYATNMYADFDVTSRSSDDLPDVWEAPGFGLFDVGLSHTFNVGEFEAVLNGKINNLFNTEYISDAQDNGGFESNATVYYGTGRTYSVGLKVNF